MSDDQAAPDVPEAPEVPDGPLRPPVRWLLAPDLIAYGKQLALHAFYGGELDPRDWMRIEDGHGHVEDAGPDPGRERDLRIAAVIAPASGELWFDYVADTGDGGVAMYTVAYVLQAELAIAGLDHLDAPSGALGRAATVRKPDSTGVVLPRGQFVFVGGDTAYHVADVETLTERFQIPFVRAHRDLAKLQAPGPPRRLYGLPGNHDYYAELVGFNRLFRHGVTDENQDGPAGGRRPPLGIPGLVRVQEASYLAIQLPWGWQLRGLDIDTWLDARQEWYFRSLPSCDRLILATPSPAIAHGAVVAEGAHLDALARLDLPPLFDGRPEPTTGCRLDLSGDFHHYARYQPGSPAPDPGKAAELSIGLGRAEIDAAPPSYAAIVSGGGGAFHHPSFQKLGELPARALYPRAEVSRQAISARLLQPWSIADGGLAWLVGLVLSLFITIGATRSAGTRWLCDRVLAKLGIVGERAFGGTAHPMPASAPGDLGPSLAFLGFGLSAVVLLYAALRVRGTSFTANQRRAPSVVASLLGHVGSRTRRYLAMGLGATGVLLPFSSPFFVASPLAATLWFNAWWVLVLALTVAGSVGMGRFGGRLHRWPGRAAMSLAGLIHGLAQVTTPFVFARLALGTWWIAPTMLVVLAAALTVGRLLLGRGAPGWVLGVLWVGSWLAAIAIAVVGADGVALAPAGVAQWAVVLGLTALVTIAVGCAHLGWYLAFAAAIGAHGNEIGGAARIDDYRQFIRFRLTERGLTGFVIAIDHPSSDPTAIRPYVVDVFEVRPRS